ncbi:hypothetical protein K2173_027317 [Erythroxylum novogranatense]|uniref:Uncharacterized protein n=1 Tax=Erythroxylum novogranatense TaxID=1862640 RepID=A0AAV8U269_9ROSI|nr:hypothetical protein K2173_027317 [Erythroxylum novogranatense]
MFGGYSSFSPRQGPLRTTSDPSGGLYLIHQTDPTTPSPCFDRVALIHSVPPSSATWESTDDHPAVTLLLKATAPRFSFSGISRVSFSSLAFRWSGFPRGSELKIVLSRTCCINL